MEVFCIKLEAAMEMPIKEEKLFGVGEADVIAGLKITMQYIAAAFLRADRQGKGFV